MNEIKVSTPPQPQTTSAGTFSCWKQEASTMNRFEKGCAAFAASFQEALRYVKAFFVGWGKKITAKNEKEAAEADLQTAQMQVEATDAAENTKKELNKSL